MDYEAFKEQVWPNIREIYKPPTPPAEPTPPVPEDGEITPPPVEEEQVSCVSYFFVYGLGY